MDYRKINSHIILLLIGIAFSIIIAGISRFIALTKGFDTGTANIAFLAVLLILIITYLIILSTLSHIIVPWVMKKLPERKKRISETLSEDIPNEKEQIIKSIQDIKQTSEKNYIDKLNAKIEIFLEYTHLTMAAYITEEEELLLLDEYISCYAKEKLLTKDALLVNPVKLKKPDMFHFGWNMAHYFGYKKQDVVPWLQQVFKDLQDLEPSYIKGKLYDYQKEKYIIPNIDDIPQYLEKVKA